MISWKSVVYTIIMCCILLSVGCLSTASDYPKFLSSKYEYILEITTTDPLYNATFYLPLPVKQSTPMVGSRVLSYYDFLKEGYTVSFTETPPAWDPIDLKSREYIIPENEPMFVEIHSDYWPMGSYTITITNVTEYLNSPEYFANTLNPVGNESIILPKLDFSPPQPERKPIVNPFSDWITYSNQTRKQTSWVYLNYSTDSKALVSIFMRIRGSNYWLDDYDTSVGNHYQDSFYSGFTGKKHGVNYISGEFTAGNMVYPDLSSSKWQQFMKKNSQGS
jgi:hypothetical protein